jgi:malate dehydrogenase (oxaloacetate-decarboxylating)
MRLHVPQQGGAFARVAHAITEAEVRVDSVSDRTFLMHKGGKIEVNAKLPLKTRDDLSMAYTPGVARVSMAIHEEPAKALLFITHDLDLAAAVCERTAVMYASDIDEALHAAADLPTHGRVDIATAESS